jgi:hypothetical protein
MIRTLLFSTLYPNSVRPSHGIFVETRLRHLLASGQVETRVIAPVPWFPFQHTMFGDYAHYAAIPHQEEPNGIQIDYPRYLLLLPKIGMNTAPYTLARTGLEAAKKLIASGYDFDLIDAHYFYPDGVAATMIGKALNKPVVINARGTDINLIPQYPKPQQMILQATRDCDAMITVGAALKDEIVGLGGAADKVTACVTASIFNSSRSKTNRKPVPPSACLTNSSSHRSATSSNEKDTTWLSKPWRRSPMGNSTSPAVVKKKAVCVR